MAILIAIIAIIAFLVWNEASLDKQRRQYYINKREKYRDSNAALHKAWLKHRS